MKFRKKPVVIEATQWHGHAGPPNIHVIRLPSADATLFYLNPTSGKRETGNCKCEHCGNIMYAHGWIDTLEGGHIVCPGDWIITGVKGELYPCKPEIFAATYEPVDVEGQ